METIQVRQERRPEFADLIDKHKPEQDRWEMNELLLLLSRFKPYDIVLEIGTHVDLRPESCATPSNRTRSSP